MPNGQNEIERILQWQYPTPKLRFPATPTPFQIEKIRQATPVSPEGVMFPSPMNANLIRQAVANLYGGWETPRAGAFAMDPFAQTMLKLPGQTVISPELKTGMFSAPIEYLIGHELGHTLEPRLISDFYRYQLDPTYIAPGGYGNRGYLLPAGFENTLAEQLQIELTPSGIETWLGNYPPHVREVERKAHIEGMRRLLQDPTFNPYSYGIEEQDRILQENLRRLLDIPDYQMWRAFRSR